VRQKKWPKATNAFAMQNWSTQHTLTQEATRQQGHPATVASVHAHRPPPTSHVLRSIPQKWELGGHYLWQACFYKDTLLFLYVKTFEDLIENFKVLAKLQ